MSTQMYNVTITVDDAKHYFLGWDTKTPTLGNRLRMFTGVDGHDAPTYAKSEAIAVANKVRQVMMADMADSEKTWVVHFEEAPTKSMLHIYSGSGLPELREMAQEFKALSEEDIADEKTETLRNSAKELTEMGADITGFQLAIAHAVNTINAVLHKREMEERKKLHFFTAHDCNNVTHYVVAKSKDDVNTILAATESYKGGDADIKKADREKSFILFTTHKHVHNQTAEQWVMQKGRGYLGNDKEPFPNNTHKLRIRK